MRDVTPQQSPLTPRIGVRWCAAVALALGALGAPPAVLAQEGTSGALAKELATLMGERKLDAFAIEDRANPGFFIAVRSYPGVQLLVVGAKSNSNAYVKYQLDRKQYGEAYSALNASAVPETKLFFQDMGCDGLSRDADQQVDVMYERASTQVLFDGEGKASGLSKSAYAAKLAKAEAQYRAMVAVLLEGLRGPVAPGGQ